VWRFLEPRPKLLDQPRLTDARFAHNHNELSWRSIIAFIVFALVFVVMRFTHFGRDIRAVGGDRRASRMVGVEEDRVLIGVFVASAVCSALGGILLAYSFATALSNPGLYPLQFAVTAAIVGGVMVGGVGGPVGIAAGALTLSLLQELFSLLAAPTYLSSLITGILLLLATFAPAPGLGARWKSFRSPRPTASPLRVGYVLLKSSSRGAKRRGRSPGCALRSHGLLRFACNDGARAKCNLLWAAILTCGPAPRDDDSVRTQLL
jgi:ABC-type uncharacterized transport system permease subunit